MHPVTTAEPAVDEEQLSRLEHGLFRVMKTVALRASRDVAGGRVDRAGYFAMTRLEQGPLRLSDLAESLELDPSTVSRQVKNLEDLGLVARDPDPNDRRASLVGLTEVGRTELETARRRRWAMFDAAMTGLSDDERNELARLVQHLADNLTDPTRKACP